MGFHVSVGKPVYSMEVQWEEMSSVAKFEYDREDGLCKGVQQRPRAEGVLEEQPSGWPLPQAQKEEAGNVALLGLQDQLPQCLAAWGRIA